MQKIEEKEKRKNSYYHIWVNGDGRQFTTGRTQRDKKHVDAHIHTCGQLWADSLHLQQEVR